MKSKLRILVVDDHPSVRAGVATLLQQAKMEIVGEAGDGDEAVKKTQELRPDVVVMDARMPKKDGLWALKQIRSKLPEQRVIMLSTFADRKLVAESANHGASEYLLKDAPSEEIVAAVIRVCRDEPLAESSPLGQIKRAPRKSANNSPLTSRETQVLQHISTGLSNTEIGQALGISAETVKEHVANLIRKLDVEDRTQAAVWAVKAGYI